MDFALHPDTWDLHFAGGKIATVSGPELFCQQLQIRLKRQLGEWMWDTSRGIPYREEILVRNPDLAAIAAHFKATILGTPGALRLDSFEIERVGQLIQIEFVVVTADNKIQARAEADDVGALMLSLLIQPIGSIL